MLARSPWPGRARTSCHSTPSHPAFRERSASEWPPPHGPVRGRCRGAAPPPGNPGAVWSRGQVHVTGQGSGTRPGPGGAGRLSAQRMRRWKGTRLLVYSGAGRYLGGGRRCRACRAACRFCESTARAARLTAAPADHTRRTSRPGVRYASRRVVSRQSRRCPRPGASGGPARGDRRGGTPPGLGTDRSVRRRPALHVQPRPVTGADGRQRAWNRSLCAPAGRSLLCCSGAQIGLLF